MYDFLELPEALLAIGHYEELLIYDFLATRSWKLIADLQQSKADRPNFY
jgi:hypothetical protein